MIDDTGNGIGKGRVGHSVEYDGSDSYLPGVGFAPGLGGDDPRQQVDVTLAVFAAGAAGEETIELLTGTRGRSGDGELRLTESA